MSSYDFIVDDLKYSYSTLSGFETCNYSFMLSKIDCVEQIQNFFSDYGKLIHKCFEKYFLGELEAFELSDFYKEEYDNIVKTFPPPFPAGMEAKYKEQGELFFDFFSFNKADYDVLLVEKSIDFIFENSKFIAKPDLLLRNKNTGKTILVDYKTSTPFVKNKSTRKETLDNKKLSGYYKQLYVYAYSIRTQLNINIDEIMLWFPRVDRTIIIDWNKKDEDEAVKWMNEIIEKIKTEEKFKADSNNKYFCSNLCSVRLSCKFWQ